LPESQVLRLPSVMKQSVTPLIRHGHDFHVDSSTPAPSRRQTYHPPIRACTRHTGISGCSRPRRSTSNRPMFPAVLSDRDVSSRTRPAAFLPYPPEQRQRSILPRQPPLAPSPPPLLLLLPPPRLPQRNVHTILRPRLWEMVQKPQQPHQPSSHYQ